MVPDRLNGIGERFPVLDAPVQRVESGYARESRLICTVGHGWVPGDAEVSDLAFSNPPVRRAGRLPAYRFRQLKVTKKKATKKKAAAKKVQSVLPPERPL